MRELFNTANNPYEQKGRIPNRPMGPVSDFVVEKLPILLAGVRSKDVSPLFLSAQIQNCLWRS